jgi:hypothetical protein
MLRLQLISLFLAVVMSIQMAPLKQIGVALSSNQWTEELPHGVEKGESEDGCKEGIYAPLYLPVTPPDYSSHHKAIASNAYIHTSEQIPSNHSTDVVSPPPDAARM